MLEESSILLNNYSDDSETSSIISNPDDLIELTNFLSTFSFD